MDVVLIWREVVSILNEKCDEPSIDDEKIRYDFDSNFNVGSLGLS